MGRVSLYSKPVIAVTAESLLSALRDRLNADGWVVTLVALPGVPPALKVGNPAVPMMRDRVMAALMADGSWWFWWSFGERVADASDLDHAVAVIGRVLGLPGPAPADATAEAGEMNRFGPQRWVLPTRMAGCGRHRGAALRRPAAAVTLAGT